MEQSPSLEANRCSASQNNSLHFMEPEGWLPRLQEPATCPYPKPDQSSPCPAITLPEDPSEYYPPICAWVFQVGSFPQLSPTKTPYAPVFSLSPLRPQVKHVSHYANIREARSRVPHSSG